MSDIGGAGSLLFSLGDKLSRYISHFSFMNFVLGALFMVGHNDHNEKDKPDKEDALDAEITDFSNIALAHNCKTMK